MNFTNRYQLKKPLQNEYYNIDEANENMDVIDAELGKAEDHRAAENPHSGATPITRKVAGKELSDDIELDYVDIGGAVGAVNTPGDAVEYYQRNRVSGTGAITAQGTKPSSPLTVEVLGAVEETGAGDKSPDNPYALVAAGGEAKVEGKNLVSPQWDSSTSTQAGITCSCYADGSLTLKGTNTSTGTNNFYLKRYDTPTSFSLGAGDYTLSGLPDAILSGCALAVYQRAEGVNINLAYINSDYRTRSFHLEQPRDNLFLVVAIGAGITIDLVITPQLERGNVANPYTPYIAPQTFAVSELCGIPDGADGYSVRDELTVSASGSVDVLRRVKAVALDGTENWASTSYPEFSNNIFSMNLSDALYIRLKNNYRCSHFKEVEGNWTANFIENACAVNISQKLIINHNNSTDVTAFKAWLAAQKTADTPVTVWYELATPVVEHIAEIDPLLALPGATTLALDGVSTELAMDYLQADAMQLRPVILRDAAGPLAPRVPVGMVVNADTDLPATAEDFGAAALVHGHTAGEIAGAATVQDILALQGVTADHEARIIRLEDAVYNNITGNPWAVTFDTLAGITLVKGCWNLPQQRLEC